MLQRLTLSLLILLAFLLPFEFDRPLLTVGPLLLTNVELLSGAVLALAALLWLRGGRPPLLPQRWLLLALLLIGAMLLSALLAPSLRANALKAVLRTISGMLLAASLLIIIDTRRRLLLFVAALVAGGLTAALLGLAEYGYGADFAWLRPLRQTPTVAGPFLRLAGPFDYANQAAMYIEGTLPLLLGLCWLAWQNGRRRTAAALGMLLLLYCEAAILTFSRASFATLLLVNLALAAWLALNRRRRPALLFGTLAAAVALLIGANMLLSPVFRLRLSSESDSSWYLAQLDAPATLRLGSGERRLVTIAIANQGAFTWRSQGTAPVNLAARWVLAADGGELARRPRWQLPQPVPPDTALAMTIALVAPVEPGAYRLVWDMVQENVVWFSAKTGREAETAVIVSGERRPSSDGDSDAGAVEAAWQFQAPIPGRRTLWAVALQLWRTEPLFGIGLDNYRLRYGETLNYALWNETIHSNNWYLETLVSFGVVGALPFALLMGLLLFEIMGYTPRQSTLWPAAIAAALLAYFVHGLLDYFLLFNSTQLLFWLLVGLWLAVVHRGVATER